MPSNDARWREIALVALPSALQTGVLARTAAILRRPRAGRVTSPGRDVTATRIGPQVWPGQMAVVRPLATRFRRPPLSADSYFRVYR